VTRRADSTTEASGAEGPLIRLRLVWLVWVLFGLFFSCKAYYLSKLVGYPRDLSTLLFVELVRSHIYFFCTVPVLAFAERFPVGPGNWPLRVAVHFAAGLLFAVVTGTLSLAVGIWQLNPFGLRELTLFDLFRTLIGDLNEGIYIYWATVFISLAAGYYNRYRREELRNLQFETELTRAQLQSLKAQLHPHFLFNTLNALTELIHAAPQTAERAITQLAEMLRVALRSDTGQEVALREELKLLRRYTDIQQTLMQERLTVSWEVEPETLDACVPNLILQPLVENSIRHGIAPRASGGSIEVSARRADGFLLLGVRDDGLGMGGDGRVAGSGVGLANTRARLKYLYGDAQHFEIEKTPGGGTTVRMSIPFRVTQKGKTDEGKEGG
jgi:sensor histidine kinase YesM